MPRLLKVILSTNGETWTLEKDFTFEAAHKLPYHDHKCQRLHGHSWKGTVFVTGNALLVDGAKQGMIADFADIKIPVEILNKQFLDRHYLNESTGLENPTSEALSKWIYDKLQPLIPGLAAVRIEETCTSRCTYTPTGYRPTARGNGAIVG